MRNAIKVKNRTALTLVLCFCVILLAGIFTLKASINKIQESAEGDLNVSEKIPTEQSQNTEDSNAKSNDVDARIPVVDSQPQNSSTHTTSEYILPANGKIIKEYSMDSLVYSVTLDQWMTHSGVDISGKEGNPVYAIADGTITSVQKDDTLGLIVTIDHGNGIISKYGNLASNDIVEEGDVVKQGATIGTIGDSSLYESADKPHLHLEMLKDGEYQNPGKYINFS